MAYSIGTEYFLVWITGDESVDAILDSVLRQYGFELDAEHGCYYVNSANVDEDDLLLALEEEYELFDIVSNLWEYLNSYQVPKKL